MVVASSLDTYISRYAELLGRKAVEALEPLYVPGVSPEIDLSFIPRTTPGRKAFPCQANVINAIAAAWKRTRSLIICGEMGTGKTLLGAAGIHAAVSARKPGEPYRVLIMSPSHLIDKWEEEILMYVPGATVRTFDKSDENKADDSYKQVLSYVNSCRSSTPGRWNKPLGPEWVIVGRNQAKWEPDWKATGEHDFEHEPGTRREFIVSKEEKKDARGFTVYKKGRKSYRHITAPGVQCPTCGSPARTDAGLLMSAEDVAESKHRLHCKGRYLQEIAHEKRGTEGYDCMRPVPAEYRDLLGTVGKVHTIEGRKYVVKECGSPLWSWIPKPRKWAPARIFHKKAKNLFDFYVLDEMHECKSDSTGQGAAAGKCMAASKRVLGLTGTLVGGFAHHLFPLLMRMAPKSLIDEGFEWKGETKFAKAYGRIDKVITTKFGDEIKARSNKRRGATSMASSSSTPTVREEIKPGIMPTFFGRHLIDKAVFISLDELYEDLPSLVDDDRSLKPVEMAGELREEYQRVVRELVAANNALIQRGCMKLMSTMLHTLLAYPDKPFGWEPPPGCEGKHSVGYFVNSDTKDPRGYVGVVSPRNFDEETVWDKEQELIDLIVRETSEGRQCWVYCEMTGKRDVQTRLSKLLKNLGYQVKVLRSNTVEPRERRKWIADNGPNCHVIISNPDLVSTGLDFFDRAGTFNFSTIIFYQPSYDINATRQAGHRHWRIGQQLECRTYYMYYNGSMQHRAVKHCGDKLAAAKSLEGKFSAEGMAALADGGLAMTELARSLSQKIEDPRASWAKLRGSVKAKVVKLMEDKTLPNLAFVAAEHHDHAAEATAIADLLLAADTGDVADDDDLDVPIGEETLSDFIKAMSALGISIDDL